ncbi:MAG: LuxR C-terminal-related transcriptional regulator [Spirochaetes bacterium]|nr:LuxR C-terminal-related transcriptional regulator [Spirochaetota bacterium]
MAGATIFLSRATMLHRETKERLEKLGFEDVIVTDIDKDALNFLIRKEKPKLLMIDSAFYQACTPYMTGELHRLFPKLNIAAISVYDYPQSLAPWFIWHGATSYANLWEGYEEFHKGLEIIKQGKSYISPKTQELIDLHPEWPDTKSKVTKRMQECLILLCCGFEPQRIGEELGITKKTVYNHIGFLYETFHVRNREEMVALAWQMGIVTQSDIRFYGADNNKKKSLPEWAAIKMRNNERIYGYAG